jgi:hypothetical protein
MENCLDKLVNGRRTQTVPSLCMIQTRLEAGESGHAEASRFSCAQKGREDCY